MAAPAAEGVSSSPEKDHWSPVAYGEKVAPFVPLLTTKVVALLDPQPTDTVLDLGCGDGVLTSRLSHHVSHITGLDSSPSMLSSALASHSTPTTTYHHHDIRHLPAFAAAHPTRYTKLFSNAALHWILRDAATRPSVLRAAHDLLVPSGVFVAELGAHGNVAEVHAALVGALLRRGVPAPAAAQASPWWFPTEGEMRAALEHAGFVVGCVQTELRQTVLTRDVDGGGGVAGWVRLFGAAFLEMVQEGEEREGVVDEVLAAVEAVGRRPGGEVALNYVRLRFLARRPE